ncbi:acyltransferase [Leptospira selangorensis]|uniref:Acyltransferase n=1 Tax=Leptospira selangorensis TaxID=2484982 RepID=A0A5F2BXM5_9LEPT|nr:acyltransferase family protein [Leptospira selangorensis]TGM12131.1 acyltransferase [Leptospira selangorensis]TGM14826.1 acyltransferase [Leptospira selangorensis]
MAEQSLPAKQNRLDYLDNLRSFALLLGLAFHVAIVYAAIIIYPLRNNDRSIAFDVFGEWVHLFRMPMFFVLSGYFTERIYLSKTLKEFLRLRALRIILPLIPGIILFAPMQYYVNALQEGYQGNYFKFLWEEFLLKNPAPSHLWFILYLALYTFLYLGVRPLVSRIGKYILPSSRYGEEGSKKRPSVKWETLLIAGIWCTIWTCGINYFFLKDQKYLNIEPVQFIYDFSFFLFGSFLIGKESTILKGKTNRFEIILLGFLSFIFFGLFYWVSTIDPYWSYFGYTGFGMRILHIFLKCLGGWIWIAFFIRLFQLFFNKTGKLSSYLRESSLPVYLIHHPISLGVGFLVISTGLSIWIKFSLHIFFVYALTFLVYHFVIRDSNFWLTVLGNKGISFKRNK